MCEVRLHVNIYMFFQILSFKKNKTWQWAYWNLAEDSVYVSLYIYTIIYKYI